jgi:catecholate siderophore receptor
MLAYEINQWKVQLNIKNLLDTLYFDSVYDNGGFTVPGTRRTATVSAEYRF